MMKDLHDFLAKIDRYQAGQQERGVLVSFLGDSNTCGWGRETIQYRESYPTRLLEALHDRYPACLFNGLNAGIGGDTLAKAMSRIERDVLRYEPDLVILCFGVNDAGAGLEHLPQFRENLRQAVQMISAVSALILLTPTMMATRSTDLVPQQYQHLTEGIIQVQRSGLLDAYVEAIRVNAHEFNIPLADAYHTWQQMAAAGVDTTLLLANGLNHPFGHAHRFFSDAIIACIEAVKR